MRIDDRINWEKECTGCFACLNICPKKAIDTQISDDGFLYPLVDSDLCIDCGLCKKVCGIYNNNHMKTKSANVYSSVAVDSDVRVRGSSGGMFELMARQCIDNGGVVYGAVYNVEARGICHTSTETELLEKLLKSKYVQSYVGNCYSEIGDHIKNGKKVLFAGTPCQVRGLKSYLEAKGIYGDITTVDFFCHGVPSPKLFSEMVEHLEKKYNSKILNITFREKDEGWHTQTIKAYFENGDVWKTKSTTSYYYYFFLNNYSLRDSCYKCKEFDEHTSDIILADNWMMDKEDDDDLGTSLVIINTEKGASLFEDISDKIKKESVLKPINYSIYSHEIYDYRKKIKWLNAYKNMGFEGLSGSFFKTEYRNNNIKKMIMQSGGIVKGILRRLIRRRK